MIPYNETLAGIHDRSFSALAKEASGFISNLLRDKRKQHVVDLGCGSGILAARLLMDGHQVTGVDYSPHMISLAQQRVPGGTFTCGSLFDYELPRCGLVAATGEVFNYLFDEKSGPEHLDILFGKIFRALQPGGFLVFDLLLKGVNEDENPRTRTLSDDAWSMDITVTEHPDGTLTRNIEVSEMKLGSPVRHHESHRQRLYDAGVINGMLRKSGFSVRQLNGYGSFRLRKGHTLFMCERP